jgi:hypothetical protein
MDDDSFLTLPLQFGIQYSQLDELGPVADYIHDFHQKTLVLDLCSGANATKLIHLKKSPDLPPILKIIQYLCAEINNILSGNFPQKF